MDRNLRISLWAFLQCLALVMGAVRVGTGIEEVNDTQIMNLLTGDKPCVILFTKSNCPECEELLLVLENIAQELKESLGVEVARAHNSQMVHMYDPDKEPALIFFRHGIPLLYYGDGTEEDILRLFNENRDPVVKELADENFEHLTQAATGATTGDWFVFFYSVDSVLCLRLHGIWESVGARLKHRLNVARMDRLGRGLITAKRFGITKSPEFIFVRQGKVYRYRAKDYSAQKLIEFAESGYRKQLHPEPVPPEYSYMNEMLGNTMEYVRKHRPTLITSLVIALVIMIRRALAKRSAARRAVRASAAAATSSERTTKVEKKSN